MSPTIRVARPADAQAMLDIYGEFVDETPVTFDERLPASGEWENLISTRLQIYPWLVAERLDQVCGYAYASEHRSRPAYRWSVDVSIYLAPQVRGMGLGTVLYKKLFSILVRQGFYTAHAGITLPNVASQRLHEKLGFRQVADFPQVGYKAGRWHHVGWWSLALQPTTTEPPREPTPFAQLDGIE